MPRKPLAPTIPAEYIALRALPVPFTEAGKQDRTEKLAALVETMVPALAAVFDATNGKASSFTLGPSAAVQLAIDTEARLAALGVPKAERGGTVVTMSSGGPSANSYRYAAAGTSFSLRRDTKGSWSLVSCARIDVHPKQPARTLLRVSAAARDAIVRHALVGIEVAPSPADVPAA
jgi:hypothetical protein